MAIGDVIRFFFVGDNTNLKTTVRETDMLLHRFTGGAAAGLSSLAVRFAGLAGGAFVLQRALELTVGSAIEAERAYNRLSYAVDIAGQNWKENESRVRLALAQLQRFSTFTDEEGAEALQIYMEVGMDLNQALSLLTVTADIATAKQKSLAEVAQKLSMLYQGQTRGVRDLGIVLPETASGADALRLALEKLMPSVGGAARNEINSTADAWKNLKNQIGETMETIGDAIKKGITDLWFGPGGPPKIEFFGPPPPPPITTPDRAVLDAQELERRKEIERIVGEEQQKVFEDTWQYMKARLLQLADIRRRAEEDLAAEIRQNFLDTWEAMKAMLRQRAQGEEIASAQREQNLLQFYDNAHRLAGEFGRFLGQQVENFLHAALQGLQEIKGQFAMMQAGGIGAAAGGLGLAANLFGFFGSIVGLFDSGANTIARTGAEVIRAIQQWINSLRGETGESLQSQLNDVMRRIERAATDNQFIRDLLLLDIPQEIKDLFAQRFGRQGNLDELLSFWRSMLQEQLDVIKGLDTTRRSTKEIIDFLKSQTRLDFQRGQQLVEFFAAQNNLTAEEKLQLYEALRDILGDRISEGDLMSLLEIMRQLREDIGGVSVQEERALQVTRSVAGITENQANLVVGYLATLAELVSDILEIMERKIEQSFGGLAAGTGGMVFQAGSITVVANSPKDFEREMIALARTKGNKI